MRDPISLILLVQIVCRCMGQGDRHRDSKGSEDNCYGDCRRRGYMESW